MANFTFFHKDWFDYSNFSDYKISQATINLNSDFFNNLKFDSLSLSQYRRNAALECSKLLGNKPALCFSGGLDSQAMVQCFVEANLNFDIVVLVFKNNLNIHDVSHARLFAETYNLNLIEIEVDVIEFLARENYTYGEKYKCASPHFNTHFKFFNILRDKGYSSAVAAGNFPFISIQQEDGEFNFHNFSRNSMSYINYSNVSGFYCQGNFLSFYPELCWAACIKTPKVDFFIPKNEEERNYLETQRYKDKILGYTNSGFNIIPQEKKFTGFELVKDFIGKKYNDGWAFERFYRNPLEQLLLNNKKTGTEHYKFFFADSAVKEKIVELNNNYFLSS